jgi:hypothetical protein
MIENHGRPVSCMIRHHNSPHTRAVRCRVIRYRSSLEGFSSQSPFAPVLLPLVPAAPAPYTREMCAYGVHTCEMHVYEVHTHEMHACEVHAYEVHAYEVHAREVSAHEMHAGEMHAYEVHAREVHACCV